MDFTWDMAVLLLVGAGAMALFVTERLTPDLVALLAVLAILITGIAEPEWALAGFSNPAVHTIAALFVISAGLIKTGAVETFGRHLIRLAGKSPTGLFLISICTVVVLSAFINNTPIVVMMIPVMIALAEANGMAPSKLLIPISYASIMGGCCTLIGTSTNLVVSGMAAQAGLAPFSMFELAPLGVILAVVGVTYLVLFGRRLLPSHQTVSTSTAGGKIREYVTELLVRSGSPLIGRALEKTVLGGRGDLRVLQAIRGEEIHWPPLREFRLEEGDLLLAKGPAGEIILAGSQSGVDIIPDLGPESVRVDSRTNTLAELVITPGSRFEGATIAEVGFHQHFGVSVLAIQRSGHHIREKVREVRIRTGDVLLVQGDARTVDRMKGEDGVILLEGVESAVMHRHRAPIAVAIALGVILAATLSGLPVVTCALAGALLMVFTGCLSARALYRSLDIRTLVLIAGMIGVGVTARETGTAEWIAKQILGVVRPLGPYGVLAILYLMTNLVTEFLSNAAAAVLMFPLALSMAAEVDASPRPFMVAVAFAASAAFSSPIGYQTNTIVYGPGGYRFTDYPRVGLPLNLIFWALATLLIPMLWPF